MRMRQNAHYFKIRPLSICYHSAPDVFTGHQMAEPPQVFHGEWDDEGVFFYQAFNDHIADWALQHQRFGGPQFNRARMTWIKPSFAWVLYRAGYGHKDKNQRRILKIKLRHDAVAEILSRCAHGHGGGGTEGRVQWDPARDLMKGDGKEPHKAPGRAIQIGMKGALSQFYVNSAVSIEDVTALADRVRVAHLDGSVSELVPDLPVERPYNPHCPDSVLAGLQMLPGDQ